MSRIAPSTVWPADRPRFVSGFRSVTKWVRVMLSLTRQRQHLAELEDHLLRDIGLDRRDAEREAGRPIWDVPAHWPRKD